MAVIRSPSPGAGRRFLDPGELLRAVPLRVRWSAAILLVAASLAYSFFALRTRVRFWNDFAFIYAAGRAWLEGSHPYDFDRWNAEWTAIRPPETEVSQPMPFVYPPYWAPLAIGFATLPWPVASRVWDAVNVVCFALICVLSLELGNVRLRGALKSPEVWIFVALAGFNPALHYAVWQSQMSVVSTLGIVGAFWAFRERKTAWLATFTFIAALKPQLGLLPLLYIFINGGHAGILAAAAAALAVSAIALLPHAHELPAHLARIYELHMQLRFNTPKAFTNLVAVAASHLSGSAFQLISLFLAIFAAVGVARVRRNCPALQSDALLDLGMAMSITGALMPIHAYDLAIYCPIAILAYQFRTQWLGMLLVVMVLFAGRAHVFATYLHAEVAGGYLTGLLALGMLVFVNRAASKRPVEREPKASFEPTGVEDRRGHGAGLGESRFGRSGPCHVRQIPR